MTRIGKQASDLMVSLSNHENQTLSFDKLRMRVGEEKEV